MFVNIRWTKIVLNIDINMEYKKGKCGNILRIWVEKGQLVDG